MCLLTSCSQVCSLRTNGNRLWNSCVWRKLVLTAAGEDSSTHEVRESHLGSFFNTRGGIRRWRNAFLECQMRQTGGTRKEQVKDEGKSSRLRPQAEQIQDSATAGSSWRQVNRADCGRKKIRPVNTEVPPWTYTGRRVWKECSLSASWGNLTVHKSHTTSQRSPGPLQD